MLVALILVGLAMRIVSYSGLGTSDSLGYIGAAANLAQGHYLWQGYRAAYASVGLVVPICPLVAAGGYASWLPALYSLACGVGLMVITCWLASRFYGGAAGLWAVFVVAFSTLAIGTAMAVMPDTPLAFWSALAVAMVVHAQDETSSRKAFLLCLSAGVALGIAWTTKITVVFMFPIVLLPVLLMKGRRAVTLLAGCAGFLLVFVSYIVFFGYATGQPLDGFRIVLSTVSGSASADGPLPPRVSLWAYPIKMFVIISDDGLFYYYLVPAFVWAVWKERQRLWLPLVWVAVVFLCLQFGTTSPFNYRPFPHNARYLMMLLPAGAVLIGAALARLASRRKWLTAALACVYASVSGFLAFLAPATASPDLVVAKAAVRHLCDHEPTEVFSDRRFAGYFNYVRQDFDGAVPPAVVWLDENLAAQRSLADQPGAFVVRYDGSVRRYHATKGNYGDLALDSAYAWLDRNADKTVIEVRHAPLQRAALGALWWAIRPIPFPEKIATRLNSAFSRHLTRPLLIIYQIRQVPDVNDTPTEGVQP